MRKSGEGVLHEVSDCRVNFLILSPLYRTDYFPVLRFALRVTLRDVHVAENFIMTCVHRIPVPLPHRI